MWKRRNCHAEDKYWHSRILGQRRQGTECTTSGLTEAAIECLEGSSVATEYWLVHSVASVTVRSTLSVDDKALAPEAVGIDVSSTEPLCILLCLARCAWSKAFVSQLSRLTLQCRARFSLSFPSCFFSIRHADSHYSIPSVALLDSMSQVHLRLSCCER